jgi:hypothetical protein
MCKAAVLLIIFNRPKSTQKVFDIIKLIKPERLYISADAPRIGNEEDLINCARAREITENIDWPCEVKRLYQQNNLGCSHGPRAAFKWLFSFENEGIILEDDCLPNISFFQFCEEMLERYRNNKKIMLVNGCNLGYNLDTGYSYGYSRIPNMWGWATWKRSELLIDYELKEWKPVKHKLYKVYKAFRQSIFDTDLNWYRYWVEKFNRTINQPVITWWDWQWIYFQTKNKMLSVFPEKNLVTNIGFDEDATHTFEKDNPSANLKAHDLNFPLKYPAELKPDNNYEENCLKWTLFYHKRLPFHFHLRHNIKKVLLKAFKK